MASSSVLAKLAVIFSANTAELNKSLATTSGQLKNFNNLANTISKSLAAFGVGFGVYELARGVKYSIGILSDFEKTMSEVRAITGATGDEFQRLQADALRLGSSTKYTATQVGQLQVAYGRLGFTTKEILDATEATLSLAAATGEDLAKSADVAGSTVRGFGLQAKETQRVVDVMASSFNKTALGLENFTESMKYVAPVAHAAGASVEETTALLGVLADAGIRGSMAGTSLRKIFTDMTKDGRPLSERLAELAKKGITLQDSFDEVGRTAQTSLLILSKNTEKTNQLASAFQHAGGEAAKMAAIMSDNLAGDVVKLESAFEGLILTISKSDVFRTFTQNLTGLLNALSGNKNAALADELEATARAIKDGFKDDNLGGFINNLSNLRKEVGKPIDLSTVEILAQRYQLTSDQANILYRSILKANEALSFQEEHIKKFNDFVQKYGYKDLNKALEDYKRSIYELIVAEEIRKRQLEDVNPDGAFNADIKKIDNTISGYKRVIRILNEYSETFDKVSEDQKNDQATPAIIKNLEYYRNALKDLNAEYDQTDIRNTSRLRQIAAEIAATDEIIKRLERLRDLGAADVVIKEPSTKKLTNVTKIVSDALTRLNDQMDKTKLKTGETTKEIQKQFLEMGPAVASGISAIAEGLGQAVAGVGNFGQTIIKALAGFIKQIGESLIAIGTGMLVAKLAIKNPVTAIAAGAALVALSAAMAASMSSAQANFNSGSSGGNARVATQNAGYGGGMASSQDTAPQIAGVIRGEDLWLIYERHEKNNKWRKSTNG